MFTPGTEVVVVESSVQKTGPRKGSLGFVCFSNTHFVPNTVLVDDVILLESGFISKMTIAFSRFGYEHNRRFEKKQITVLLPLDYRNFPVISKRIETFKTNKSSKVIYAMVAPVTSPHTISAEDRMCYVSAVLSSLGGDSLRQYYRVGNSMPEYEYAISKGSLWYNYIRGIRLNNTIINRVLFKNSKTLEHLTQVVKMIETGLNVQKAKDINSLCTMKKGTGFMSRPGDLAGLLTYSIHLKQMSDNLFHPIFLSALSKILERYAEYNILDSLIENTRSLAKAAVSPTVT